MKIQKVFKVVPQISGAFHHYRVDEQHSLLWGLIKVWRKGSCSLGIRYFKNAEQILDIIPKRFPGSKTIWTHKNGIY